MACDIYIKKVAIRKKRKKEEIKNNKKEKWKMKKKNKNKNNKIWNLETHENEN